MVTIKQILCPVDFSEGSRHAIDHAAAIARWYRASISALHVYHPMFTPVPGLPPPEKRVTEAELNRVRGEAQACVAPARASGVDVDILIDIGQPAHQILGRAATLPADLIVMGT